MDAAGWAAEFARREAVWRFERAMFSASVAAKIEAERAPAVKAEIVPIVLEAGHDVDLDDRDVVPSSARSAARAAAAAGWFPVDLRAALAAMPGKGLVRTLSLRARRHDERFFAIWRAGAFDVAWYVGPGGLERLGWARMPRAKLRGVMDVIEGVRGPRQWVAHFEATEREQTAAAVGLISQAFPGLQLTRH